MQVGLRVVRGKNWNWKDQDGGEGNVGTIVDIGGQSGSKNPKNTVVVQWDSGAKANYRAGYQSADDLRVLDNASAGVRHTHVNCDVCSESGMVGIRWHCEVCHDFDLCHVCYMAAKHDLQHPFSRWDTPLSLGVIVTPRASSRRIQAKGTYPGAKVVRGLNWNYKNQDGGADKQGLVQSVGGSSEESSWRSWIKVKWDAGGANDYKRGHDGNVDVKCVKVAPGEQYYIEHLPGLCEYAGTCFSTGDRVKLNEGVMSANHKEQLKQFLGKTGNLVVDVDKNKVYVRFPGDDSAYTLPMAYITKVESFSKGDVVLISNDIQAVTRLQAGHGGWNDQMRSCIGQQATVIGTDSDGDVKVMVGGNRWILNTDCCRLVSKGETTEEASHSNDEDSDEDNNDDDDATNLGNQFLKLFLQAMAEGVQDHSLGLDNLVKEAANGRLDRVQAILARHPNQADYKEGEMTALQVASHQGHKQIVVLLISKGAKVDMTDNNGDNAIHFATIGEQSEVLEYLLSQKPGLVNSRNNDGRTSLHLAVVKQNARCMQVLLKCGCNVNIQDKVGDTALHDAISKADASIQNLLISCPKLDLKLKNDKGFNVLHCATTKNNKPLLEKLLAKAPMLVNVAKEDGFTALHLAALNGLRAAAECLIKQGKANLDMPNVAQNTPLLVAVNAGRCSMIELLVSNGADINVADKDGDTALHLVLIAMKTNIATPPATGFMAFLNIVLNSSVQPRDLEDAPAISTICSQLSTIRQGHARTWIAIACYLVQNGAQMDQNNCSGSSVNDMTGNDLQQLLMKYAANARRPDCYAGQSIRVGSASVKRTPESFTASVSSSSNITDCMMCLKAPASVKFYPCGHQVTCAECSGRMKTCFSCHEKIQEKVRNQDIPKVQLRQNSYLSNNVPTAESVRRSKMTTDSVNCPICDQRVRNVVFLCGHSCCAPCSEPLTNCHVCSSPIGKKLTLM